MVSLYSQAAKAMRVLSALMNYALGDDLIEFNPVSLAIQLVLYSGLRKNEALQLRWSDSPRIDNVECLVVNQTKNGRPHCLPITKAIRTILRKAENDTEWIFPSTRYLGCVKDERHTIRQLSRLIDYQF